jgi:hypothetical protein
MKQQEAKPLVIAAWDEWVAAKGLAPDDVNGRDALQFYYELQDKKSPLLKFIARVRDKWEIVHDWLIAEGRLRPF